MEFDPPIATRSTDELIEIANFPKNWNSSAIEQAQQELANRGITTEQQLEKVSEWKKQFRKEHGAEMEARAIESYGFYELAWMAFKWPYAIFGDWSLRKDGYIRMHKERLFSIGTGILLWGFMLIWVNVEYERSQREWQNEVNRQDIYEWEKENYSDEEIAEFRRESIEKVIQTVRDNDSTGIPTYVILDKDTILNSQVKQLRNLDVLNIRDVVFWDEFEPEPHEWITIKLVKPADSIGYK